jgi:hypothetical protein
MKAAELVRLRDRVHVSARNDLQGGTSIATVELADGRKLTASTDTYRPLGDLPRQRERVRNKFVSLVAPVLGAERAAALGQRILEVDGLASVRPLLELATRKDAA